jgi:hypothetical protein
MAPLAAATVWHSAAANRSSAQLTVFAATAVVPAERGGFAILSLLTARAQSNARYRDTSRFWNRCPAIGAMGNSGAAWQATLSAADPILYRRVNLILNRAIARPTRRHARLPLSTSLHYRSTHRGGCRLGILQADLAGRGSYGGISPTRSCRTNARLTLMLLALSYPVI